MLRPKFDRHIILIRHNQINEQQINAIKTEATKKNIPCEIVDLKALGNVSKIKKEQKIGTKLIRFVTTKPDNGHWSCDPQVDIN